jgi:predicted ATP-grasp superfamily ATP-dependent carboligase
VHIIGPQQFCSLSYSRRCKYKHIPFLEAHLCESINEYCVENKIDVVIPVDMKTVKELNIFKTQLKVPLFISDTTQKINLVENKSTFYEWMRKNTIRTPNTQLISDIKALESELITYPVVLKPLNLGGGRGIKIVLSKIELEEYLSSGVLYSKPPLLVQEYIDGEDIDVSVIANNGVIIAYTIQKWHAKGILEFVDNSQAYLLAKRVIKLLSYSGIAHFDMRCSTDKKRVYILECNPRFWGSCAASYMMGINFIDIGIKQTLNIRCGEFYYRRGYYVLIGSILNAIKKMNIKYFSIATFRNIIDVLSDPLPYIVSELQILLKLL